MTYRYLNLACGLSNRRELDDRILAIYPELDRILLFLDSLRALPPNRRGALVYRIMEVLELTRSRFLRKVLEGEDNDD